MCARFCYMQLTYMLGAFTCIVAYVWIFLLNSDNQLQIFGPAILLGFGCSTILITSLGLTADLIGRHTVGHVFLVTINTHLIRVVPVKDVSATNCILQALGV